MKAIEVHEYGGADVLVAEEVARPVINPDDVLIKVYASGVNPVDWKVRQGYARHELPFIPGWDVSGVIEEVGSEVKEFQPGDEVYGRPDVARDGSYAEYIAVRANELAKKPRSIDHTETAAIPLAGLTAWQALFEHGKLEPDHRVFIHGGSGGVGTYAIQFARWRGAYVIATASPENHQFLKDLGAHEVVDYHDEKYLTQYRDIDVMLDTIGGDVQIHSLAMMKNGGILVTTIQIEDKDVFETNGVHIVSMLTKSSPKDLKEIARLVDSGVVEPIVSNVFPLEQARKAQELSEKGHVRGKIVLKVR